MAEDIKLVVCDLDGTLLNDRKEITPYTGEILKKVQQKGVSVCLASGRDEQMMSIYEYGIGGCEYILSNNGALLKDRQGEILYSAMMEEADAAKILTYLNEHDMTFMMYTADRMYFSEGSERLKKRITDYEKLSRELGHDIRLAAAEFLRSGPVTGYGDIVKIVAYEEDEARMLPYTEFLETLPDVHNETTGYGLKGAFHRSVSKRAALYKVMEHMGIGKESVCVFGDYDNDLSMFECADHRICMENGVEALKQAATYVTKNNNEDGVAVYLARVLGIK